MRPTASSSTSAKASANGDADANVNGDAHGSDEHDNELFESGGDGWGSSLDVNPHDGQRMLPIRGKREQDEKCKSIRPSSRCWVCEICKAINSFVVHKVL